MQEKMEQTTMMKLEKLNVGDRVGVLTSGGDSPGMNSVLRAVVKMAKEFGLQVVGIQDGYAGLLQCKTSDMPIEELDAVARRGGTWLSTARSHMFRTDEGRKIALKNVEKLGLKALVVVGGNGSLAGAENLMVESALGNVKNLRVAGIPASIDNDVACTSMSIGVDTAINTIVDACDRIADTASAHHRTFIVEVMGRDCGYLAMMSGIAVGADMVLARELGDAEDEIVSRVIRCIDRAYSGEDARRHVLVIKSESIKMETDRLKEAVDQELALHHPEVDSRVTVLGHVVRGGSPSAFDRLLGARLGHAAIRALMDGQTGFMTGLSGPGVLGSPCDYDPNVILTSLKKVREETAKLHRGDSMLATWRKKIYYNAEPSHGI